MDQMFRMAQPGYPLELTQPMEKELSDIGVTPLKTPEYVEEILGKKTGTVLLVVNSVCGCAAGMCRPGVALALKNEKRPDQATTVFAGVDREAVDKARSYSPTVPPSSPSITLFKNGEPAYVLERHHIEGHTAEMVAEKLISAFEEHC